MPSDRLPCRVCGRDLYVRVDGDVGPHSAKGQPCSGSNRPPAGEPPCSLYCSAVGAVSWPEDLLSAKGAMASTHVCANPEHQHEASLWVEEKTGHRGVFEAFKRTLSDVSGSSRTGADTRG